MKTCSQIKKKIASVCLRKICDVMIGYLIIATITVILVCLLLCFYDVLDVSTIFANIVTGGMLIVLFSTYSSTEKEKRKEKERQSAKKREADERQITAAKVVYLPTLQNMHSRAHHFTRRQQWLLFHYCQEVQNLVNKDRLELEVGAENFAGVIKQIIFDGIGLGNGNNNANTPREWFGELERTSIQLTDKETDALLKISQIDQPEFIALAMIVSNTLLHINARYPYIYHEKAFQFVADHPQIFKNGELSEFGELNTRKSIDQLVFNCCLLSSALGTLIYYQDRRETDETWFDFLYMQTKQQFLNVSFCEGSNNFDMGHDGRVILSSKYSESLEKSEFRKIIEDKDKFYKMLEEHCGKELARDAFNRP